MQPRKNEVFSRCRPIERHRKEKTMKSFHEQYKNQIKLLADRMSGETMPPLTEELFALFETTGNRLKYEDVFFTRRKFLAVFGMAAYLWRRPADVARLEDVLLEICREECWALPAHVNRRENSDWRLTVDLFAAETAQALAEIVTLVGDGGAPGEAAEQRGVGLSAEVCEKVKFEIERRVVQPFEAASQGWECSDHNWNAVCCGSIGSAAMYLLVEKEEARLKSLLKRICHSLTFYLEGFRADGACMEGIGYFTYGMTYFTGFAEQLLRYSHGKINLFDNDKVWKIAEFQQKTYFRSGQTVSFSDGESQAKFRMGLTCFLAKQFDTVRLPNREFACDFETDPCYRFMGLLRDYLWTAEAVADEDKIGMVTGSEGASYGTFRHDVLPYAQWSICESKNGIGFAIKGGDNGEPHNHNDVGSFFYLAGGEQLICDLGAGEYTGEYFGEGRYNILCNSSEGHSVPVINGEFQKDGKQYAASFFEADGKGTTKIEFAGAYAEGAIEKLVRTAEFSLEDGSLTVTDSFEIPEHIGWCDKSGKETGAYVTETLVTQGEVSLQDNRIMICGNRASCLVQIEGSFQHLHCIEKTHSNHEGGQEIVRLVRWEVVPEEKQAPTGEKGTYIHGISKYIVRCI